MYHLVMIDWAGPALSGEQMLVMRNILSLYLRRRESYERKVNFTHLLVEGKLTFRGTASFGTFYGNRFFLDFGTHNNLPWYSQCLLPANREYIDFDEDDVLFSALVQNNEITIGKVNIAQCAASYESLTPGR